jgi:hypothetical protein
MSVVVGVECRTACVESQNTAAWLALAQSQASDLFDLFVPSLPTLWTGLREFTAQLTWRLVVHMSVIRVQIF